MIETNQIEPPSSPSNIRIYIVEYDGAFSVQEINEYDLHYGENRRYILDCALERHALQVAKVRRSLSDL